MKNNRVILNDSLEKYRTNKTLIETLIDNCPMNDYVFDCILEVYKTDEQEAMNLMVNCEEGKFERDFSGGWNFELND